MAMNAGAMADAIIKEMNAITNDTNWNDGERPPKTSFIEAFDKGLIEYVEKNMEITYSWKAELPPPASTPDPVVSFASVLIVKDKSIGQPQTLAEWGKLIMACFKKAEIKHSDDFSAVTAGKLLTLELVIVPQPKPFPDGLKSVCDQVCQWLLTCIDPVPLSGVHGSYAGATTGMVIA